MLVEVLEELEVGRSPRPWLNLFLVVRAFYVLFIALPVAIFVVTYIMPTFVSLLEGMALNAPLVTRILIMLVKTLRGPLAWLPLMALGLWLLWTWSQTSTNPALSRRLRRLLSSLPWLSRVIHLEEQAVAASTLATCERLGLSARESLTIASAAVEIPRYRQALLPGDPWQIGAALAGQPDLFAPPLAWLACQGEAYGNLAEALTAAGHHLSEEADAQKARCAVWLDTAATGLVGVMTGVMVLGVYLPIIQVLPATLERLVLP